MVASKNEVVVGVVAHEVTRGFANRIGRPRNQFVFSGVISAARDFDKPLTEEIHPVGLADVPVERRRVELRQHEDATNVGVQAVADRDVDEAILPLDRNGRLRTQLSQREEA